jgi:hypothetical protein
MGLSNKPSGEMESKAFLKEADKRADFVIAAMGALTAKLREFKPQIEESRRDFRKLKGNQTIAGCKTWAEFCEKKLHRTDRAVRKMLADPKPSQANEQQSHAEQSSASPKAEEPSEAHDENGEKERTEGEQRKTAEETPPLSKADEEEIAEKSAKDQAISKTIGYLSKFDSGKEFRVKFADFVSELREEFSDNLAPELWDRLVQVLEPNATVSEPKAAEEEVAV